MGWRAALTLMLVLAVVAGCARIFPRPGGGEVHVMRSSVEAADLEPYRGRGTARIEGTAIVGRPDGGTETCGKNGVLLVPAIDYIREGYEAARDGYVVNNPRSPLLREVVRTAQCDSEGRFSFDRLPAGEWFVSSEITWNEGVRRLGGTLGEIVNVDSGDTTVVFLSADDIFER